AAAWSAPPPPLRLPRALGAQRADRRVRVPFRAVRTPARRAPVLFRGPRHAGGRHADRPVPLAPVARAAQRPAAPASRRSLPGLRVAPGAARRGGGRRARLGRVFGEPAAPATPDGTAAG